jgi:hypothetical protein
MFGAVYHHDGRKAVELAPLLEALGLTACRIYSNVDNRGPESAGTVRRQSTIQDQVHSSFQGVPAGPRHAETAHFS